MPRDHFKFRKENQLKKEDKSFKQEWDEKIAGLCNKLNKLDNFYTTSSCSGRIVLLLDCKEKRKDLFLKIWHDKLKLNKLKETIKNINSDKLVYFKQDPCILHVACKTLEDAQKMHDLAKDSGWKRCGIISSKKRFIVELNATEKLEFPIVKNKKCLVDDNFLKLIVKEANKKLDFSWGLIERFKHDLKDE